MKKFVSKNKAVLLISFVAIIGFILGIAVGLSQQGAAPVVYLPLGMSVIGSGLIFASILHQHKEK
jgi:hypothetical protein